MARFRPTEGNEDFYSDKRKTPKKSKVVKREVKNITREYVLNNPKRFTVNNFFISTQGSFQEIMMIPEGFKLFHKSKGSEYYTDRKKETLVRSSDHWGYGINNCYWHLKGTKKIKSWAFRKKYGGEKRIGIIKFESFKQFIQQKKSI